MIWFANRRFHALLISVLVAVLPGATLAQPSERPYDAVLVGKVGEVNRPESVWIGALEVRLRGPFILEDQREAALGLMQALAVKGREIECRLTGERLAQAMGGTLVGDCVVFGPTDGRDINLGDRLIERGFARPCKEPQAVIAIWPPVFVCE